MIMISKTQMFVNKVFTFRLSLLAVIFLAPILSHAQVNQRGVVMEYQERQKKTPLPQVEVRVTGAGSTVSGAQGQFLLKFRTLKAGDKVVVQRIEKTDYEIFNREALDQWHISSNDREFLVVMCRKDRFQKIRNGYERIASESFEKQLKREEAQLKQQRENNKLSQQKYEEKLTQLRNEYEERLESLDNYIDRFTRIDQSELTEAENRIVELVKAGKIDEAVKAYDALGLESKYQEQEAAIARAQADIDRLSELHAQSTEARDQAFAAIRRKNDLLYMAGGSENIAKIGVSLRRIAEADTTYYPALEEYANYLIEQQKPIEALSWYRLAELHSDNDDQRITSKIGQASAYMLAGHYEESLKHFETTNDVIVKVYKDQEVMQLVMQRIVLEQMANMYTIRGQYQDANDCWMQNVDLLEKLVTIVPDNDVFDELYANGLQSLAHVELKIGHINDATSHAQKSIGVFEKLNKRDSSKYELGLASARHTLAEIYYQLRKNDQALSLMNDALPIAERYYMANPRKQSGLMVDCSKLMGSILRTAKRLDEAERHLRRAIQLNEEALTAMPSQPLFKRTKANYLVSLGWVQNGQGKYTDARQSFQEAVKIMQQLGKNEVNQQSLVHAYYGIGNILHQQGKPQEALPYYQRALPLAEKLYREASAISVNDYHLVLYALSSTYFYTGKTDEALTYANRDIDLMKKHQGITFDQPENSAVMGAYICQQRKQYDKAMEYTDEILKLVPSGVIHAAYVGFKGQLLDGMGRQQEAKNMWEQALRLVNDIERQTPDDLQNLDTKGELLLRLGRKDDALQVLKRLLQIDPQFTQKHANDSSFLLLLKSSK